MVFLIHKTNIASFVTRFYSLGLPHFIVVGTHHALASRNLFYFTVL